MDSLFDIAKAQGADEIASPTIPFTVPFASTSPSVTGAGAGPSISLQSDKTNIKPGEKATITISINTQARDIQSFAFQINYDSSIFSVLDADTNTPGTQIKYNDQFFLVQTNTVNASGISGTISVKAATTQGSTTITNRVVAQFDVLALKEGFSNFDVTRTGSFLLNLNSVDILTSVSGVSLTSTNQVVTTTKPPTTTGPFGTITPRTALNDDIGGFSAIGAGVLCVAAGIYLWTLKRNAAKLKR
jgi:hypothetical protein